MRKTVMQKTGETGTRFQKARSLVLAAPLFGALMASHAGLANDKLVAQSPCKIAAETTSCRYMVNDSALLKGVTASLKDMPDVAVKSTLYSDMDGSQGFTWLVNLPGLERKESREMRDRLMSMMQSVPSSIAPAMFVSDDQGLNVIAAQGSSKADLMAVLKEWDSPEKSESAIKDLIDSLKVAGATQTDHKAFQWITSGIQLSASDSAAIQAAVKASGVRFSIVLLLESESDVNRFAAIKQLATDTKAYYSAQKRTALKNPLLGHLGYFRNGAMVSFASKDFCAAKTLELSFDIAGDVVTRSENLTYPDCPKPKEPEKKAEEKKPVEKKDDPKQDDGKKTQTPDEKKDEKKPAEKKPVEKQPDQKDPDQQDPEKKDPGQKDPEQKDPEQKDPGQQGPDQKAPDQKDPDQKAPDGKDEGKKEGSDEGPKTTKSPDGDKVKKPAEPKKEDDKTMLYVIAGVVALALIALVVLIVRRGKSSGQPAQAAGQVPGAPSLSGRLTISGDGKQDRTVPLGGSSMRVGRNDDNDIVINDDAVSGFHALIRAEAGGMITYTDLNSTNGTFVDNQQVMSVQLMGGEHLRIGATVLIYSAD